ncbi:MAG TPA: pilus assembly protein [Candidimonas sp.]|nr:pilus assembly protein [Candidimonas sp.]
MTITSHVEASHVGGQQGQAMVEGLVVLLALTALWSAISWLGRLQDIDLQAAHASRYAAFSSTRHPNMDAHRNMGHIARLHFFGGPAHQWTDAQGSRMLRNAAEEVQFDTDRRGSLPFHAQPGGSGGNATSLRADWHIADTGIVDSHVTVAPSAFNPADWGISAVRRHTAILVGAGHAGNDTHVQHRLAESALAWGKSAQASYGVGRSIAGAMVAVDAGWDRPEPIFDWLDPWADAVPDSHLAR